MNIIVDTREQTPWTFEDQGFSIMRKKLDAGDYSVEGFEHRISIERKSLADWVKTILRERKRFYQELELLRAFDFRCVIIEAGVREIMLGNYKSDVKPAAIIGAVCEIATAQSVPVYLAGTRPEAQILAGGLLRAAAKRFSAE